MPQRISCRLQQINVLISVIKNHQGRKGKLSDGQKEYDENYDKYLSEKADAEQNWQTAIKKS